MSREIELTKGFKAIVDDDDFEKVASRKWHLHTVGGKKHPYASSSIRVGYKKQTIILMHRFILNPPKFKQVDHINGNGLDNRKANLRICTNQENSRNQSKKGSKLSSFKGVSSTKTSKNWYAKIRLNGKNVSLGGFKTEVEAAKAYDAKARECFGEFARTNF